MMKKLKLSLIIGIISVIFSGCIPSNENISTSTNTPVEQDSNKNDNMINNQKIISVNSDFDGYQENKNGILDYSRALLFTFDNEQMEITRYDPTLSTEFYIEQVSSNKILKFMNIKGQIELPEGKYRVHGVGGRYYMGSKSTNKNGEYFLTNQNALFLSSLPTEELQRLEFEVKAGSITRLNQMQKVRKIETSSLFASVEYVSFAGFKTEITNDFSNKEYYFEYGFDKSVNIDYVKIGKKNPSIYYVQSMSSDLIYHNTDKSREIYNLKSSVGDELVNEFNKKHLLEQKYFFSKYLNSIPVGHVK